MGLVSEEKPTLPSSPLQKMNKPLLMRLVPTNPFSRRARGTIRAFILALTIIVLISVLNELRCEMYGCTSRVSFYSVGNGTGTGTGRGGENEEKGGFVGGGAAIGSTWKEGSKGQEVTSSSPAVSTPSASPPPPPPPPPPAPTTPASSGIEQDAPEFGEGALMSTSASEMQNPGKEAGSGKWVDKEAKEKALENEMKKLMNAQSQAYEQGDPAKALLALSSSHAVSRPAPPTPTQTQTQTTQSLTKDLALTTGPQKQVDTSISELESMEDHFRKSASRPGLGGVSQHATWEQGEGQEDPVRVTMPVAKNLGKAMAIGAEGVGNVEAGSENAMLGSMNMGVFGG